MPTTKINVSSVIDVLERANREIDEQEAALSEIQKTFTDMQSIWEAEDQMEAADSFSKRKKTFDGFYGELKIAIQDMNNFVTACVEADELSGKEIRGVIW